jgi:hypothetical protein
MKKIINARFKSKCAETGCTIQKGERMLYDYEGKKAYAIGSNTAVNFINTTANSSDGNMVQANEDVYFDDFCARNNI